MFTRTTVGMSEPLISYDKNLTTMPNSAVTQIYGHGIADTLYVLISAKLANDTGFPFKRGERVIVEIVKGDGLRIRKATSTESRGYHAPASSVRRTKRLEAAKKRKSHTPKKAEPKKKTAPKSDMNMDAPKEKGVTDI